MEIVYFIFIGILILAFLFGVKDWIIMFMESWDGNGKLFTIFFIVFIVLAISPAIVKDLAPEYHGLSIWAFILYSLALLGYRNFTKGSYKYKEED